jgi:hypothetical protein
MQPQNPRNFAARTAEWELGEMEETFPSGL